MINEAADIDFHKYDYGENNVINVKNIIEIVENMEFCILTIDTITDIYIIY